MSNRDSLQNIYNSLYAGDKLRMKFGSLNEWTSFRTLLYRFKKQQDDGMKAVTDDHQVEQLRTQLSDKGGVYTVTMSFQSRPEHKTYEFEVVSEDSEGDEMLPGIDEGRTDKFNI